MTSTPETEVKVLSAQLVAHPGKQAEFHQTLKGLRQAILLQEGCLECSIGLDGDEGTKFLVFMVWKSQAHLEAHMDSEAFRVLLGAAHVLTYPAGFRFITAGTSDPTDAPPPRRTRRPL
jgi:quinol monooxygenase YgiN